MHDRRGVGRGQRRRGLDADVEDFAKGQRAALETLAHGFAFDELRHQESRAVVIADLVDRQDVGMIERRGGTGLMKKAAEAFRIAAQLTPQDLERHRPSERGIERLVDVAHAAAAEQALNLVAADGRSRIQRHRRLRLYRRGWRCPGTDDQAPEHNPNSKTVVQGVEMTRTLSALFACLTLLGAPLAGQDKPVFAGTWKLSDPAAPDPFTPTVMTVVQDATALTVMTTSQMGEFKTSYKLDGSEAPSPMEFNGMTIDRIAKLVWEGNKLLLITTSKMEGQSFEFKSTWSLTADGVLATETTVPDFQGGGAPITIKATYKKS